jgi:hypothetical protein
MRIDFRFSSMPQRAIWYAGAVQYVAFCILLLSSDSLLGVSGFNHLRMIVANAADVLLFAFPNCLFPLMFWYYRQLDRCIGAYRCCKWIVLLEDGTVDNAYSNP